MHEYVQNVGDTGKLIVQDKTDTAVRANKVVDIYIQSLSPVAIPNLAWRWYTDDVPPAIVGGGDAHHARYSWNSFNFQNTTVRQHVATIFVDYAHEFTLVINDTGTSQLDGPAEFNVQLANQLRPVSVKFGTVWKQAIPYVRVEGVWKPALAMVMKDGSWKEAT